MTQIRQPSGAGATAMLGLGTYRPERVVTNDEICEVLDSSDEWIRTRSGIRTRRYAGEDESPRRHGDGGRPPCPRRSSRRRRPDRHVIVATSSHAQHTPAAAPLVADRLGSRAAAFDVSPAAPAAATRCRWAPTWCAAATRRTCW